MGREDPLEAFASPGSPSRSPQTASDRRHSPSHTNLVPGLFPFCFFCRGRSRHGA